MYSKQKLTDELLFAIDTFNYPIEGIILIAQSCSGKLEVETRNLSYCELISALETTKISLIKQMIEGKE